MEPPELIADGMLLRGWRPDNAEAVHRACQDPDIQRWTTVPSPYRLEHARDFVAKLAPDAWAAEKAGFVFVGTARRALSHRGRRRDAWVGALVPEEGAA